MIRVYQEKKELAMESKKGQRVLIPLPFNLNNRMGFALRGDDDVVTGLKEIREKTASQEAFPI
jgi:hypothetical protein